MFYISLPYFYENFDFNNFFKNYVELSNRNKNSKLVTKFNIEYVHGAFPWSLWNGDMNVHRDRAVLSSEVQTIFKNTETAIRLNASNINLQKYDYFDIHENATLKLSNGTNNIYEISLLDFIEYLSQFNLNNKYIISNNAQLICPFTEETINVFQEQPMVELINIGYNTTDLDLSKIVNKNKLEISIGHCGKCSLEKQLSCADIEQKNIYNYSNKSLFVNCSYENKINNYYEAIIPFYKQGIQHFKLTTNSKDLQEFNINIIKSFVKPEYVGECINEYYRTTSKL